MPLLQAEAEKLSNNTLEQGVIEEIIVRDAMFALLPFTRINSKALVYNREATLPGADWLSPGDTVNEEAATFEEVVAKLRILAGDVDVDNFLRETMSDTNDQLATQIAAKSKGLKTKFHICLAQGDATANAKQFDGLPNLVTSDQTIIAGANGAPLTLALLDQLKHQVVLGADAFIMRAGTERALKQLMRAAGGTTPPMIQIPNFNGAPVLGFDGVPCIINDYLAGNETQGSNANTCSIYAVRFNENDGLHGLYGGDTAGVRVEEVGTVQNKDAQRIRLKWYVSLALKSTLSIARLKGITNI
jgi:hypothetical protein